MEKIGSFITIQPGETLKLILQLRTIRTCWKHYHQEQGRSFLCSGPDCRFDHKQHPPRLRYQSNVIVDGENLRWEFGELVYSQIQTFTDFEGYVNIKVTRVGRGTSTQYQISQYDPNLPTSAPANMFKCTSCGNYILPAFYVNNTLPHCQCRPVHVQPAPSVTTS